MKSEWKKEIGEPVKICCGHSYCLLLTKQHEVWSWGVGSSGSLGLGIGHASKKIDMTVSTPEEVYFPPENNEHKGKISEKGAKVMIKAIASGSSHCLALTTNGNVYSWGNG
jgi:alpha-tubulin suppressor-like RCC1 family protein